MQEHDRECCDFSFLGCRLTRGIVNAPPPPPPAPVLKEDETVINTHYMKQLLQYGMKLAGDHDPQSEKFDEVKFKEMLAFESKVCIYQPPVFLRTALLTRLWPHSVW